MHRINPRSTAINRARHHTILRCASSIPFYSVTLVTKQRQ